MTRLTCLLVVRLMQLLDQVVPSLTASSSRSSTTSSSCNLYYKNDYPMSFRNMPLTSSSADRKTTNLKAAGLNLHYSRQTETASAAFKMELEPWQTQAAATIAGATRASLLRILVMMTFLTTTSSSYPSARTASTSWRTFLVVAHGTWHVVVGVMQHESVRTITSSSMPSILLANAEQTTGAVRPQTTTTTSSTRRTPRVMPRGSSRATTTTRRRRGTPPPKRSSSSSRQATKRRTPPATKAVVSQLPRVEVVATSQGGDSHSNTSTTSSSNGTATLESGSISGNGSTANSSATQRGSGSSSGSGSSGDSLPQIPELKETAAPDINGSTFNTTGGLLSSNVSVPKTSESTSTTDGSIFSSGEAYINNETQANPNKPSTVLSGIPLIDNWVAMDKVDNAAAATATESSGSSSPSFVNILTGTSQEDMSSFISTGLAMASWQNMTTAQLAVLLGGKSPEDWSPWDMTLLIAAGHLGKDTMMMPMNRSNPQVAYLLELKDRYPLTSQMQTWQEGATCATWQEVYCDTNGTITEVFMMDLIGSVPTDLHRLPSLTALGLGGSFLTGELPPAIFSLTSLTALLVEGSKIKGELHNDISKLASLKHLRLRNNQLTGQLPLGLAALTQLMTFDISRNRFYGVLPPGTLKGTQRFFDIGSNYLTGPLPLFSPVRYFNRNIFYNVADNYFTLPIPEEMGVPDITAVWAPILCLPDFPYQYFALNCLGTAIAEVTCSDGRSLSFPLNPRRASECTHFCKSDGDLSGGCGVGGVCAPSGRSLTPTCICPSNFFSAEGVISFKIPALKTAFSFSVPSCSNSSAEAASSSSEPDETKTGSTSVYFRGLSYPQEGLLHSATADSQLPSFNSFFRHASNGATVPPWGQPFWSYHTLVDWRTRNVLTPVKEQKSCSACWVFGPIAAVEAAVAITLNQAAIAISEQSVLDCQPSWNCNGGYTPDAFQSIIASSRLQLENDVPYLAKYSPEQCQVYENQMPSCNTTTMTAAGNVTTSPTKNSSSSSNSSSSQPSTMAQITSAANNMSSAVNGSIADLNSTAQGLSTTVNGITATASGTAAADSKAVLNNINSISVNDNTIGSFKNLFGRKLLLPNKPDHFPGAKSLPSSPDLATPRKLQASAASSSSPNASCPMPTSQVPVPANVVSVTMFEEVKLPGWLGRVLAVQQQPVTADVEASQPSFLNYDGSYVYADTDCFFNMVVDHTVVIVGFNLEHPTPYWIIRNSWGPTWGDGGYMQMAIVGGDGICGINTSPSLYPVVKGPNPCGPINPCGGGKCTVDSATGRNKCSCKSNFVAVINTDKTETCTPRKACQFFLSNPCSTGTCVDDNRGGYSCLCPFGFVAGTRNDGSATCTEGTTPSRVVLTEGATCSDVQLTYNLTTAALTNLNPGLDCSSVAAGSIIIIGTRPANALDCIVPYTAVENDTCSSIASLFDISVDSLTRINSALDCSELMPGRQLCVAVGTRQPLECLEWYAPRPGESCETIRTVIAKPALTPFSFFGLNPGISCSGPKFFVESPPVANPYLHGKVCIRGDLRGAIKCQVRSYIVKWGDTCSSVVAKEFQGNVKTMRSMNPRFLCSKETLKPKIILCAPAPSALY